MSTTPWAGDICFFDMARMSCTWEVYTLIPTKRRAYFCRSIAMQMGAASRHFSKLPWWGVDVTLLKLGSLLQTSRHVSMLSKQGITPVSVIGPAADTVLPSVAAPPYELTCTCTLGVTLKWTSCLFVLFEGYCCKRLCQNGMLTVKRTLDIGGKTPKGLEHIWLAPLVANAAWEQRHLWNYCLSWFQISEASLVLSAPNGNLKIASQSKITRPKLQEPQDSSRISQLLSCPTIWSTKLWQLVSLSARSQIVTMHP